MVACHPGESPGATRVTAPMARYDERGQSHADDGCWAVVRRWGRHGLMADVDAGCPGLSRRYRCHLALGALAVPVPMPAVVPIRACLPALVRLLETERELGLVLEIEPEALPLQNWCCRWDYASPSRLCRLSSRSRPPLASSSRWHLDVAGPNQLSHQFGRVAWGHVSGVACHTCKVCRKTCSCCTAAWCRST
jgi:hypothetical protein